MAYDGLFIKLQIEEIKQTIKNEHIAKITQNSQYEVDFIFRKNSQNITLNISINPNFPHIKLDSNNKDINYTPPAFCMLLRKYLQGGIIKDIYQVNNNIDIKNDLTLERIIKFEIENINEAGERDIYHAFIEIMGKYSNIIITDKNYIILDTLLKNASSNGRINQKQTYSTELICNKTEILNETEQGFIQKLNDYESLSKINNESFDLSTSICQNYAGLSKQLVTHIIKSNFNNKQLVNQDYLKLFNCLKSTIDQIISNKNSFAPCINYKSDKASDLYVFKLNSFEGEVKHCENINACVNEFVSSKYKDIKDTTEKKNIDTIIKNLYNNLNKKLDIYKKDLTKSETAENFKTYAELISVYGYDKNNISNNVLSCVDYNTNEKVSINIDPNLTVAQNVEKYYEKYNKFKRTKENALKLIDETVQKIEHLNSISLSLNLSNDKNDIYLIKEEILEYFGEANKYELLNKDKKAISKRKLNKSNNLNYNIHHYKSSSGIDIYVGKNNLQNEYLTFKVASPDDTWLHIKNATGSHVIVKKPYEKLDDKTLVEAASLAAYFSEKRNETKATVDYTLRKELKKVKGKAPGFCIYHKNYSINVKPEVLIKEL